MGIGALKAIGDLLVVVEDALTVVIARD